MLKKKQNFLETLKKNGKPDRIVSQFEGLAWFSDDPVNTYVRGTRYPGMAPLEDRWGTLILWPEGVVSSMPHVTDEIKVVKDVTQWQNAVTIPEIDTHCTEPELWGPFMERVESVNRNENLVMAFAPTGVFERLHFLMGFEDTFINLMTEPEAMMELCIAIGDFRLKYMQMIVEHMKPDVMLSHDDWGSKTNMFISPELWREFIKPQYEKIYGYLHDQGIIIIHHSDSFLEQIVEDMVDLHIDVWQGVLPQNDIVGIQKQLDGRMTLMGGLEAAIVDREDSTEEEIRAETRRALNEYTPNGHFIPSMTYGSPGSIYPQADKFINDEIARFNKENFR